MAKSFNIALSRFVENAPFKATGSSMLPILQPDDFLYFKRVNLKSIKTDDIVLVKKGGQYIVHRVIYRTDSYIITRGDSNYLSDGKIRPNQVIGKVVKVARGENILRPDSYYLIQSSYYLKEIIKVSQALKRNNIKHVFLKGLPLHLLYEKTHPRRLYADCDILVDRSDRKRVDEIFKTEGYELIDSSLSKSKNNPSLNHSEASYRKIHDGLPVVFDIHYEAVFLMTQLGNLNSLYPKATLDRLTKELMTESRAIKIMDEEFNLLDKRYLIVYLALHFFHHNFKGAYRLEFIDKIIRVGRFNAKDWGFMATKINEYALGNFVYPTLVLVKKYYDTPLPTGLKKMIFHDDDLINKTVTQADIFNDEPRISSGIRRFKTIFYLSQRPFIVKMTVFFDPQVIYYVLFVLRRRLSYFLKAFSRNR